MSDLAAFISVLGKRKRRIIGLMSGMSMDGVDLAFAEISGDFPELKVELVASAYRQYSPSVGEQLRAGLDGSVASVASLNVLVANEFAACVNDFLAANHLSGAEVDAIGSHGQTLFHETFDGSSPCSLQVGSPSIIAELTGIVTVGNFRVRDIAAGGQGAPLVSLADYCLYRRGNGVVALNNLGSISNVTIVTPVLEEVFAFDTGPANMAIDYFARFFPGNPDGIDRDGSISAKGQIVRPLLEALMSSAFFQRPPPKAAGYQEFGPEFLLRAAQAYPSAKPEDLVRTAVELAARTLGDAYRRFVIPRCPSIDRVILSGGGTRNTTLVGRIREELHGLTVEALSPAASAAKEALAFAILANETLSGRPGNIPGVTGAKNPVVLGEIAF